METKRLESWYYVLLFSIFLFLIQLLQFVTHWDFSEYGIYPRSFRGLIGIIFAPLLHGNFGHLSSNLFALAIGLYILFEFYKKWALEIILWIWIAGGLMVWLFGRESYHLGSSGLIYGINFFILTIGMILRNFKTVALALVIILVNQGMFWGLIPSDSPISWEAHLFSAIVGINLAFHLKNDIQNLIINSTDSLKDNELPESVWNYPKNYYHHQGLED